MYKCIFATSTKSTSDAETDVKHIIFILLLLVNLITVNIQTPRDLRMYWLAVPLWRHLIFMSRSMNNFKAT